jgi:hypothetical protein
LLAVRTFHLRDYSIKGDIRMPTIKNLLDLEDMLSKLAKVNDLGQFKIHLDEAWKKNYGSRFNFARIFNGFVWNEFSNPWVGCIAHDEDAYAYTMISLFDYKPLVVRGYPKPKMINNLTFNTAVSLTPSYDGIVVSTYFLPNGLYWGKTNDIEYLDRNGGMNVNFQRILKDLGVWEKLQKISNKYNAVVHGVIMGRELTGYNSNDAYSFVALDISDRNNHAFYTKEIAESIFSEHELAFDRIISIDEVDKIIGEYGGVTAKHYTAGELIRYQKESKQPPDIRYRKVIRDMYQNNCDFCWTNPVTDRTIQRTICTYDLQGITNIEEVRNDILHIKRTPDLVEKIKTWLDGQYKRIIKISAEDAYELLEFKWNWSGVNDREMIIDIIKEWHSDMRYRSAEEIFQLEHSIPHSDGIY